MSARCVFCKMDPYEYVDVGVCMVPVAITCCDLGVDLYSLNRPAARRSAQRVMRDMQSFSPKRKARAMKALREAGLRDPSRFEARTERESAAN